MLELPTLAQFAWAVIALIVVLVGVVMSGRYGWKGTIGAIVLALGTVAVWARF